MRYRLMATYQGQPYEAGIGPSEGDVVLFAACPPPEELGFEPATGHWRKQLGIRDVQALWESRPTGTFRGEPCIILDDLGDRLHIAFLGHDAYLAERLGYWQVDRGVFELITPRDEVIDVVEERTDYPHGSGAAPRQAASPGPADPGFAPTAPDPGFSPAAPDPGFAPATPDPRFVTAAVPGFGPSAPDPGYSPSALDPGYSPAAPDPGFVPAAAVPGFGPATPDLPTGRAGASGFSPAAPAPRLSPAGPAPGLDPVTQHPGFGPAAELPRPAMSPRPGAPPGMASSPGVALPPFEEAPLPLEAAALAATSATRHQPPAQDRAAQELTTPAPSPAPSASASARRRRTAPRQLATQRVFSELADLAAIPAASYAIGAEVDGAMCLLQNEHGYEVFNAIAGARHEVRLFDDEESAYFYLFGVLAAEAVRTGGLVPHS